MKMIRSFLIIFIISLLLLEGALRVIGPGFLFLRNPVVDNKDENDLVIMTVGESTTAYGFSQSYPRQLEKILNKKLKRKVRVVNVSTPAYNTLQILEEMPNYLEAHKPHIVTFMTGINDKREKPTQVSLLNHSILYKLSHVLWTQYFQRHEMPKARWKKEAFDEAHLFNYFKPHPKDQEKLKQCLFKQNFELFDASAYKEKFNSTTYLKLLENYFYYHRNKNHTDTFLLYQCLREIKEVAKHNQFLLAYLWAALGLGDPEKVKDAGQKIIQHGEHEAQHIAITLHNHFNEVQGWRYWEITSPFYRTWRDQEKKSQVKIDILKQHIDFLITSTQNSIEQVDLKQIKAVALDEIRSLEKEIKKNLPALKEKAEKEIKITKASLNDEPVNTSPVGNKSTYKNQKAMVQMSLNQGAQVFIVQYPRLSIKPLKNLFYGWPVHFVENKTRFNELIKEKGFQGAFIDNFADGFGHFTPEGHQLVAEELSKEILKQIQ